MATPKKREIPQQKKSKLMPILDGPFKVLEKIGPNAYKVDIPREYNASTILNMDDLSAYYIENEELPNLSANYF